MFETLPSAALRGPQDRQSRIVRRAEGRIAAILGPTNTGKTHYAVERLAGHSSGMIGLPLRLLAREIYDKVVALKGPTRVALITGEEKITPPNAAYFVCTVESMPVDKDVAFVAVDEIQLAEDPERGHVFTQRLLNARGREETLFLGSESMRALIRKLIPEAEFITRPRFSHLTYTGPKKISRLPRRSAIVAFSSSEVYALAEIIRRQKGGAAVVMGALSPRTRNAQVALYEAGDVDYLVATDAIGMGLNMSINHVSFASLTKFDGRMHRALRMAEIAQIAGRAGRHMNDGSFGLTTGVDDQGAILTPDLVERIERYDFETVRKLEWRNGELDYASPTALIRSLERKPPLTILAQTREAEDLSVLRTLARDEGVARFATGPAAVALFWQVCQIPDFRKTLADLHASLVGEVYKHLMTNDGVLPHNWIARQVDRLDNTQGDIDTLATRLAHIRTWTYVANRSGWVDDPRLWQDRTRDVEDRLSDALHERLSQRFIDRRTSVLLKQMGDKEDLTALVDDDGEVTVAGHFMGTLDGFRFEPDSDTRGAESRALMNAANRTLAGEIKRRVGKLASAGDDEFSLEFDDAAKPRLFWRGAVVGHLVAGKNVLSPRVEPVRSALLEGALKQSAQARLERWVNGEIRKSLGPLMRLAEEIDAAPKRSSKAKPLAGPARGL
ncbi:MAG TPA: helicase-related protein, partial [Alphaproteobacteria bacterium]|nr:helicase-related protein [Alphaproteobacteria bacterium]